MSESMTCRRSPSKAEMWGIIPAAGSASRMQPLALSKELLPVGSRTEDGIERPCAISEYLVERMIRAGARRICFVISPSKADILHYYGSRACAADIVYAVQPQPLGLCDSIFRAAPLIREEEQVAIGLPDTVWFPEDALAGLPTDELSLLLFPTKHPERFDAVVTDSAGAVIEVQVKHVRARSHWIWGAMTMPGHVFHALHALWLAPGRRDEYLGTLINAWLSRGGTASGVRAGSEYIDAGTLEGYRSAIQLLQARNGGSRTKIRPQPERGEEQAHVFGSVSR
jgi:glucose-1-phosphate thymidylyltransferase